MVSINKRLFIFLFLLLGLSYAREVLFLSINAIINGESFFYARTVEFESLKSWPVKNLIYLKVALTILFSIAFVSISTIGLKLSFLKKWPYQLALAIYSIFAIIAFILIATSAFMQDSTTFYSTLRKMIGFMHNPILFIIISITSFSDFITDKSEK